MTNDQLEQTIMSQYANSPIIDALINNMNKSIGPEDNLEDFYNFVFNVKTAEGFALDIWGRIVGITRFVEGVAQGEYFGYYNSFFTQSEQVYTPFNNAPFFNGNSATNTIPVNDAVFRKMIYAKAYANINPPTIPAINKTLDILLGESVAYVQNNNNMTVQYVISGTINPILGQIIYTSGIIPIPAGVELLLV